MIKAYKKIGRRKILVGPEKQQINLVWPYANENTGMGLRFPDPQTLLVSFPAQSVMLKLDSSNTHKNNIKAWLQVVR